MKTRRHSPNEWWQLARSAALAWADDYAPSMGAALSYYSVFSLSPLLLIVISIAGLVFGQDTASGEVIAQLRAQLPIVVGHRQEHVRCVCRAGDGDCGSTER